MPVGALRVQFSIQALVKRGAGQGFLLLDEQTLQQGDVNWCLVGCEQAP
jgi:hypothetical protein